MRHLFGAAGAWGQCVPASPFRPPIRGCPIRHNFRGARDPLAAWGHRINRLMLAALTQLRDGWCGALELIAAICRKFENLFAILCALACGAPAEGPVEAVCTNCGIRSCRNPDSLNSCRT
jgi:hypothetical protein